MCSHPLYFDGLAHHTVPGRLSEDAVPQPHLLLWYFPKALYASRISKCVGVLLAQGSAGLVTQQNVVLFSLNAFSGVAFKAEACKTQI